MSTFHLYRLKIEHPEQLTLYEAYDGGPSDLIEKAILEKPSKEIRKDHNWKIGNIIKLGEHGYFFALGKIAKSTREMYDEINEQFIEEDLEEAPFTYAFVDLNYQICAIAHKPKIAPKVETIARNLSRLLSQSEVALQRNLRFQLSTINDPDAFLDMIRNSVRVVSFEMTFTPPNPWDVEEDFHQPMEKLLKVANGGKGKTAIEGDDLDKDILEDLTRSAVSTGDTAKAKIQENENERPKLKKLEANPYSISSSELATTEEKISFLDRLIQAYKDIREGHN